MNESLYERMGGEPALMAAADRFYGKVLADERTSGFFEDMDMAAQTRKLVAFMAWAFGGPQAYKGRDLRTAHRPLVRRGLNDEHFDAVAEHLAATLRELEISEGLVQEALSIVASTRDEVLDR